MVTLTVNGERREVEVPPEMPLLWVLRDVLGLTGTKFGCGIAQCGACTLTAADLQALITYLRSIPAVRTRDLPASRTAPVSDSPEAIQAGLDPRGKQIFEGACVSCHSWSGVSLFTN